MSTFFLRIKFSTFVLISFVFIVRLANAQIDLQTTVMIDPQPNDPNYQDCGVSHSITVPSGTPVMFCYKATNTGPYPYNFQDFSSTEYGTEFSNFSFTLNPGVSVFSTRKVNNITSTTPFHGLWIAHNNELQPKYKIEDITYDFTDILSTGTAIILSQADNGEENVTMPFHFTMAGIYSNLMTVGVNGAIRFGTHNAQIYSGNVALSNDPDENLIAPFWDDLFFSIITEGTILKETIGVPPNRIFIIQWDNLKRSNSPGSSSGTGTFQVKLFETSNKIEFHYKDVDFSQLSGDNGLSATIGIGGGGNAIEHSYNTASVVSSTALSFTRPDSITYQVRKTGDIGVPAFDFVDISATGTATNLADDGEIDVTIPFDFFFSTYSSKNITIGENGAIRFGQHGAQISSNNIELVNDIASNIIAPFWDDLTDSTGNIYYQTIGNAPDRIFIVQWDNRPHFLAGGGAIGAATFELKLFENGHSIQFHYLDTDFDESTTTNTGYDFGKSATIGVAGKIQAVQYSFNTQSIQNNYVIAFYPASRTASDTDNAIVLVEEIFADGFE